jgi:hypothetical protein
MYIAIRRYRAPLNAVDEITQQVETGFLPLLKQSPGFIEYYWLNADNGFLVSVGMFADREAAEESTRMAADYVRQFIPLLARNPPEVSEGEVLVHDKAS